MVIGDAAVVCTDGGSNGAAGGKQSAKINMRRANMAPSNQQQALQSTDIRSQKAHHTKHSKRSKHKSGSRCFDRVSVAGAKSGVCDADGHGSGDGGFGTGGLVFGIC